MNLAKEKVAQHYILSVDGEYLTITSKIGDFTVDIDRVKSKEFKERIKEAYQSLETHSLDNLLSEIVRGAPF